jgi:hypothetical protein
VNVSIEDQPARPVIIKKDCHTFEVVEVPGQDPPVVEGNEPVTSDAGLREFEAELNASDVTVSDNASFTKRPDALSFDYLTAYSIGPEDIADVSLGPTARVWRARAIDGIVYLSRANAANNDWEAEVALFNYTGEAVEIDLAFEQAARAVVCLEIAGRVWLYWFDSTISAFALTNFTAGRTPRLVLDDLDDTSNSDVLLFYINGNTLEYRQQRDRYDPAYATPVTGLDVNYFLEDVFRTTDNRIAVLYSIRNTALGQYSFGRLESTLYPFVLPEDELDIEQLIQSGLLDVIVINYTTFDIESLDISQLIQSGTLALLVITHELFDKDSLDIAQAIQSGTLPVVVIVHDLFDNDEMDIIQQIQSGTLVAIVIVHTLFDIDSLDIVQQIQSGTLA